MNEKMNSKVHVLVEAPPHDIGKIKYWKRHTNDKIFLPSFIPKSSIEDICPIKSNDLRRYVKKHHENFPLKFADRISSAIGRMKFKYSYWKGEEDETYYFFKIYGEPILWTKERRENLWKKIIEILKSGVSKGTYSRINELLSNFPQDSRFPFVSLKTHHWATQALYEQMCELLNQKKLERSEDAILNTIVYFVLISLYLPGLRSESGTSFHRLKDLREFFKLRESMLNILRISLKKFHPLPSGDDLILLCFSDLKLKELIDTLMMANVPVDLRIVGFKFKKIWYSGKLILTVDKVENEDLSLGGGDRLEISPGKAEWADVLDGKFKYIIWFFMRNKDILDCSSEFLDNSELFIADLEKKGIIKRNKTEEKEVSECISPDLIVSVADGYSKFVVELLSRCFKGRPMKIIESFGTTLFIWGINREEDALRVYSSLLNGMKNLNLMIPTNLVAVVAKPKHPFWHILKVANRFSDSCIIFLGGGKLVVLVDEDVERIRRAIPHIRNVSRKIMHSLATEAKRLGKEHLKLRIEALAEDRKINKGAEKELLSLVDYFSEKYKEEHIRKKITRMAFEELSSFTRRA